MTPVTILEELKKFGIYPRLASDLRGIEVPAEKLTAAQREWIQANRQALIFYLTTSSRLTAELLKLAMRRCDEFKDNAAMREEMRQDILNTPHHLLDEVLDYFKKVSATT